MSRENSIKTEYRMLARQKGISTLSDVDLKALVKLKLLVESTISTNDKIELTEQLLRMEDAIFSKYLKQQKVKPSADEMASSYWEQIKPEEDDLEEEIESIDGARARDGAIAIDGAIDEAMLKLKIDEVTTNSIDKFKKYVSSYDKSANHCILTSDEITRIKDNKFKIMALSDYMCELIPSIYSDFSKDELCLLLNNIKYIVMSLYDKVLNIYSNSGILTNPSLQEGLSSFDLNIEDLSTMLNMIEQTFKIAYTKPNFDELIGTEGISQYYTFIKRTLNIIAMKSKIVCTIIKAYILYDPLEDYIIWGMESIYADYKKQGVDMVKKPSFDIETSAQPARPMRQMEEIRTPTSRPASAKPTELKRLPQMATVLRTRYLIHKNEGSTKYSSKRSNCIITTEEAFEAYNNLRSIKLLSLDMCKIITDVYSKCDIKSRDQICKSIEELQSRIFGFFKTIYYVVNGKNDIKKINNPEYSTELFKSQPPLSETLSALMNMFQIFETIIITCTDTIHPGMTTKKVDLNFSKIYAYYNLIANTSVTIKLILEHKVECMDLILFTMLDPLDGLFAYEE